MGWDPRADRTLFAGQTDQSWGRRTCRRRRIPFGTPSGRSARRAALQLLKRRESLMLPLAAALSAAAETMRTCSQCGNIDVTDPCAICADPRRDDTLICVVEDVAGLWALERTGGFRGRYHVLGGTLSALDGVGPDDLRIAKRTTWLKAEPRVRVHSQ